MVRRLWLISAATLAVAIAVVVYVQWAGNDRQAGYTTNPTTSTTLTWATWFVSSCGRSHSTRTPSTPSGDDGSETPTRRAAPTSWQRKPANSRRSSLGHFLDFPVASTVEHLYDAFHAEWRSERWLPSPQVRDVKVDDARCRGRFD